MFEPNPRYKSRFLSLKRVMTDKNCAVSFSLSTHPGPGVHLGAVPEQDPDDVGLVGPGGQVQRGLAPDGGLVRGGLVLDQVDDDVHAPHEGGHVQRGEAGLGGGLDGGAVLEQQLHHLDAVLLAGDVQRGEPVQGPGRRRGRRRSR